MTAEIIDGKAIAAQVRQEIKAEVDLFREGAKRVPGLAVVLVGDDPASASYIRGKTRACEEVGFYSEQHDLPASISHDALLDVIHKLNRQPEIDGILVQLPLPKQIDADAIIMAIDPTKDVDGFHPQNVGNLSIGRPGFVSCTPNGIRELLIRSNVDTKGKFAVVVGRSNIVGKPMAQLLVKKGPGGDATVCICHSGTRDLAEMTTQADILIAAIGRAEMIRGDMIKPGAVVIDVGINRVEDSSRERGYRLVGDVNFEEAKQVASQITPVPGGVGPMTIAMLLKNTLESRMRRGDVPAR